LRSSVRLEIVDTRVEHVDAEALLVPVDGQLCRLGGAAGSALRLALPDDERADEIEYIEDALARLRPLLHPEARVIDGVARWKHLVVSAAYPHDVDGVTFSPTDCARMLRVALQSACAAAAEAGIEVLAATLIGTAYRMPADLAIRAFVDGISSAHAELTVRWSLPDEAHRRLASAACQRVQS
jgi:hypothetical protein